jgi:hypothetical protein
MDTWCPKHVKDLIHYKVNVKVKVYEVGYVIVMHNETRSTKCKKFHEGCYQKQIRGSDISVYHADFYEGYGTVREGSRYGMCELTRQENGMWTAWYVWISLYWS